jgi:hypothetical protein
MMTEPIKVTMEVARVQTLADGGTRWTFDLSEGHALESAHLIVCREQGALIDAVLTMRVPSGGDVWEGVTHAD